TFSFAPRAALQLAGCGTPDLARRLRHEFQLASLLVPRQLVARSRGREAALRAQRQTLDGYVFRRLVDAPPELVLRLKLRVLRATQAEDNHLARGHKA